MFNKTNIDDIVANIFKRQQSQHFLNNLYKQSQENEFSRIFLSHLSIVLSSPLDDKIVKKSLKLASIFIVKLTSPDNKEAAHSFLDKTVNFICNKHETRNTKFVSRLYLLLNLICDGMDHDSKFENDLCDKIIETMLFRMQDSSTNIRVQAVNVLSRFQDPSNENCQVLNAYINYLSQDPSPEVRIAIINNIGTNQKTIEAIIKRTHDRNVSVKKECYKFFHFLTVNSLMIEDRQNILKKGLQDAEVALAVREQLLLTWLSFYRDNILNFLEVLDVQSDPECSVIVLNNLFHQFDINTLLEQLNLSQEKKLISIDELTCESALYWLCLIQHVQELAHVVEVDKIIPDMVSYTCHVLNFISTTGSKILDDNEQKTYLFILSQLFEILKFISLSDDNEKNSLKELIEYTLLNESIHDVQLIETVTKFYGLAVEKISKRIDALGQIIREIRRPTDKFLDSTDFSCIDEDKDDPTTMYKCLSIINGLIKTLPVKIITPTLRDLFREIALDSLDHENIGVQLSGLYTVGLFLFLNEHLAKKYIRKFYDVFLLSRDYPPNKWGLAMTIIFNLFLEYGLEHFDIKFTDDDVKLDNATTLTLEELQSNILDNNIIKFMINLIDHEIPEIENTVIDGFWKLINSKIIVNKHIVSRLVNKEVQVIIFKKGQSNIDDKSKIKKIREKSPEIAEENFQNVFNHELNLNDTTNVLNSFDPENGSNLGIWWRGSVYMTDIAEISVTLNSSARFPDDNLLKNLPNFLNINGEVSHKTIWCYLENSLKINSNGIHVFQLTAANEEEKISYITLWSYLNRRRKLAIIDGAIENHNFYIMSSASQKKKLPAFLKPLVSEFLDDSDERHLLLGIICKKYDEIAPVMSTVPTTIEKSMDLRRKSRNKFTKSSCQNQSVFSDRLLRSIHANRKTNDLNLSSTISPSEPSTIEKPEDVKKRRSNKISRKTGDSTVEKSKLETINMNRRSQNRYEFRTLKKRKTY